MSKPKTCSAALSIGRVLSVAGLAVAFSGCGGAGSSTVPPPQSVTVTLAFSSSSLLLGNTQQFTATVKGTSNTAVSWTVNGVSGGNSIVGTISTTGLYSAPQALPNPANVTIKATSGANSCDDRQRHQRRCRDTPFRHVAGLQRWRCPPSC